LSDLVWGGEVNQAENRIMADWAARIIWGDDSEFDRCTTMGVVRSKQLIGVMVFHNYSAQAKTIEYSGASTDPRWLSRVTVRSMFDYMFGQLGCQLVLTRNSERNTRLHRQLRALNHSPHRIERLRGENEAEIVWTLTREAWQESRILKGHAYGR